MKRSELSATGGTKPDRVMRGLGLLMFDERRTTTGCLRRCNGHANEKRPF